MAATCDSKRRCRRILTDASFLALCKPVLKRPFAPEWRIYFNLFTVRP